MNTTNTYSSYKEKKAMISPHKQYGKKERNMCVDVLCCTEYVLASRVSISYVLLFRSNYDNACMPVYWRLNDAH